MNEFRTAGQSRREQRLCALAVGLLLLGLLAPCRAAVMDAAAAGVDDATAVGAGSSDPAGVQYAFNKQNPRWEAKDLPGRSKLYKPYKPLRHAPMEGERRVHGEELLSAAVLSQVGALIVLGLGAAWIASGVLLPAATVALGLGFVAGPLTGFLAPDVLFGDLLVPAVSLFLALLLFESALRCRLSEGGGGGWPLAGALLLGVIAAGAAHFAVGLPPALAALLGTIVAIVGRPLDVPGLRLLDADTEIGATLDRQACGLEVGGTAVVVLLFQGILARQLDHSLQRTVSDLLWIGVTGLMGGVLSGFILVLSIRWRWTVPSRQRSATLLFVVGTFTLCNALATDAGILSVVVMGVFLANQRWSPLGGGSLLGEAALPAVTAILLGVLAARAVPGDLAAFDMGGMVFLAAVLLLGRPAALTLSTWHWRLDWRERFLLASVTPPGSIPLALAALYTLRLVEFHDPLAAHVMPLVLGVVSAGALLAAVAGWGVMRWVRVAPPDRSLINQASPVAR